MMYIDEYSQYFPVFLHVQTRLELCRCGNFSASLMSGHLQWPGNETGLGKLLSPEVGESSQSSIGPRGTRSYVLGTRST